MDQIFPHFNVNVFLSGPGDLICQFQKHMRKMPTEFYFIWEETENCFLFFIPCWYLMIDSNFKE